jgi:hypothetical protein
VLAPNVDANSVRLDDLDWRDIPGAVAPAFRDAVCKVPREELRANVYSAFSTERRAILEKWAAVAEKVDYAALPSDDALMTEMVPIIEQYVSLAKRFDDATSEDVSDSRLRGVRDA